MITQDVYHFDDLDERFYYDGELGAIYSKEETIFRVWSPLARGIRLNLYGKSIAKSKVAEYDMLLKENGVWEYTLKGDNKNVFYTYSVDIEGKVEETIDIYAKTSGVNGKMGMVFDRDDVTPEGFYSHDTSHIKSKDEAILYELHVRDFSSDENASFVFKKKFKAFTEDNVKNSLGDVVGLDYIKNLGVTHIHLLPVFDFGTVDESSAEPSYNWGYDPDNYNVLEGSYSINPYDGLSRVREFKELVMKAHEKGLGIVMDVVYNHTYHGFDSSFSKIVPHYYYRHFGGYFANGSGCGNEIASERKMVRKFIIDSLCYLASEYRLDGFRFDLMGLLDIETLNICSQKLKEINPNIVLYGEGWTGGDSPLCYERRAVKSNAVKVPAISMFSDDFRDIIKGNVFDEKNCGYINGDNERTSEIVKSLLCGGIFHPSVNRGIEYCWTDDPMQAVNYVEAHDNYTFHDKLRLSMIFASEDDIIAVDKLGAVLIFLSQGVPFIQAGQEFLRSKYDGKFYNHNSYNASDKLNSLKWNYITRYKDVVDYYRGLIAIKRKFYEFRMKTAGEICDNISFTDLRYGAFIMHIKNFMLILNPLAEDIDVPIWSKADVYVDSHNASADIMYSLENQLSVKAKSAMLVKMN